MRLFDVSSSKNLADRVRFSSPYTDRYIQAPPNTGNDIAG